MKPGVFAHVVFFLSDSIVDKAMEINPSLQGEFTYLVNAISKPVIGQDQSRSIIPYSMVCGVEPRAEGLLSGEWVRRSNRPKPMGCTRFKPKPWRSV